MLDVSSRQREIVDFCSSNEQFIDKESISLLENEEHWKDILSKINDPIISSTKVKEQLLLHSSKLGNLRQEVAVVKGTRSTLAKESSSDFRVMKEYEASSDGAGEGKIGDFLAYFRDKYNFLHSLLSHRVGFNPKTFDKLKSMGQYSEVDVIGMVVKKWVSKNGNRTIELDSPEGRCIAIVSKEDVATNRDCEKVLLDDVIGLKGKKFSDEVLIVKSFLWPDLMQRSAKTAERDLSVALISDVHVGSRLFLEKEFSKFLSWLSGGAQSESERGRVGKIKYLVIAGDNVDGVGIYPDQYDELEIKDIYKQYEKFSSLISQIPEHIEIFICPGQHDAVRRADPQPAIPKEYVKEMQGLGNVHMVGSPSWVEIEGLKTLIYHGASFHDMIAATNHLSYKEPHKAMVELLKRRDISTGFGISQPYVPQKHDFMVIREEPDFYFGGDVHIKGYMQYRGCLVANAGCWQDRTDFQIKEGHMPTPGIAIDINLRTRKLTENNFMGGE
ncbi:MAG TPA: metallophosphoesterase [archaeon]|nr:metallophosphoesterase [archaeon]